jgi:hypothetical protein
VVAKLGTTVAAAAAAEAAGTATEKSRGGGNMKAYDGGFCFKISIEYA